MHLQLPDAINAVGACPDAMPRAHSEAVAAALCQVHARTLDTLRPSDFAGIDAGPHVAACESQGLKVPALRFGSAHRQVAYAVLGSSAFIAPDTALDAHIGIVFVSRRNNQPVHFDIQLAAPGDSEVLRPMTESAGTLEGRNNGEHWQTQNVVLSAPPMVAHGPVLLAIGRHQPEIVDVLVVTVHIQPRVDS